MSNDADNNSGDPGNSGDPSNNREESGGGQHMDIHGEQRHPTFALSEKDRLASFEIEDQRWETGLQVRDWLVLAAMMALTIGWTLLVYFLEPGLR